MKCQVKIINNTLRFCLLILFFPTLGQETRLWYNESGRLTIEELATHYRVATVDIEKRRFKGIAYEYNKEDKLIATYEYGDHFIKKLTLLNEDDTSSFENISEFSLEISEQLLESIRNKNDFEQASHIRKRDYPAIEEILYGMKQEEDDDEKAEEFFTIVEEPAIFPGGQDALNRFLGYYMEQSDIPRLEGHSGTVRISFLIEKDGTITGIEPLSKVGGGCEEIAAYAISKLPDWIPARQRQIPVGCKMILPISFK